MGRHHVRLGTQLDGLELVGVVDRDADRRADMQEQFGGRGFDSVEGLIEAGVDVVVIATPTIHHRAAAEKLLARGVHCLIEKPLAPSVDEARAIADAAARSGALLQVGHVVRYDPVMVAIRKLGLGMPRFVEVDRISPMTFRSVDVGVVLDMMIDVCNARLTFPPDRDGHRCVANVTASRLAMKTERKMRLISPDAYVSADFQERKGTVVRRTANDVRMGEIRAQLKAGADLSSVNWLELVSMEPLDVAAGEPLRLQLQDFVDAIRTGRKPFVDAEAGFAAVRTAERIVAAARALDSGKP
jgi:predicted dehydrogenase